METLVVFDSKFGNTQHLAELIGRELETFGAVRVMAADVAADEPVEKVDLFVIGGPTHGHGMSNGMKQFLAQAEMWMPAGAAAAAFDTRFRMPAVISGTAAKKIARHLRHAGLHMIAAPESFFVTRGDTPELEAGEADRARLWAMTLGTSMPAGHRAAA